MLKNLRLISFVFLTLLVAAGAFLRLWDLGNSPFPSDELNFYKLVQGNNGIVELWRNPPWMNHIPLSETFTLLLVESGLPPTPFVTRLPFAIMGSLTLLLVWCFTRRYFGTGAAMVVLILAVFNPYQLYYSRTAYYYAGATFWSTAMLAVFWKIKERIVKGECPLIRQMVLWLFTAVLACHMHMSVWAVAGLQGILLVGMGFYYLRQDRMCRNRFLLLSGATGVALLLLMSRWMYRAILEMVKVSDSGGHLGSPVLPELIRLFPAYFAGENILAVLLLFGVAGIALVSAWRSRKTQDPFWSLSWIAGLHIVLLMLYVGLAGGGVAKITYFSSIWPLFIWFLGIGLWQGAAVLSAGRRWVQYWVVGVILAAYTVLALPPAWAIVNLEGKLMPTFKINDWVLQNLPTGTPVLVDRWFHPWNEMAIHNADQINYTFTVPDEPLQNYLALKWRDTAAAFFERHPQAALLEVSPGKYKDEVGKWRFPEQHFARVISITNTAAVTLRKYCAYPFGRSSLKDESKPHQNRIFYNTTEDVIAAARRKDQPVLRLYGDGWQYLKPWQPMQGWPEQLMQLLWIQAGMYEDGGKTMTSQADLQKFPQQQIMHYLNQGRWADYRIPASRSVLRLFNLTEVELPATLTVTGIALSGNIRCMIGDEQVLFPQTLMTERSLPVTLKPGENEVIVAVPPKQLLLMHDVRITASGM